MVIGFIGLTPCGNKEAHEWLRHAISKWLARHDVELGISCLRSKEEHDFVRICARQSIPFRLVLPPDPPAALTDKAKPLLAQAQAVHQLEEGSPDELVIACCDALLVAAFSGQAELDGLVHQVCKQQRAVLVFDSEQHHTYIFCHPEKFT